MKKITDKIRLDWFGSENISPAWHRVAWHRRKMPIRDAIDLAMKEVSKLRKALRKGK